MTLLPAVAVAVWAMLPAYVPNNVAVVTGGGRPIDGGRSWGGRRLLGDGKTWRGATAGALAGAILAVGLNAIRQSAAVWLGLALPVFPITAAVALPVGAMLGDVAGSFLKRRLDRDRGASVPGLDQLDFVVGALALSVLAAPAWTAATFTLPVLAVVVVLTPVLHLTTNVAGYLLGVKREPW